MPDDSRTLYDLIADYSELCAEENDARRAEGLAGLLFELLELEGISARRVDRADHPTVAFGIRDRLHLLELRWSTEAVSPGPHAVRPRSAEVRSILLSMSGFTRTPEDSSDETLHLDATHLEAALCGVTTVADLVSRAFEVFVIDGRHPSLADLLIVTPRRPSPRVTWAHLHPEPIKEPQASRPGLKLKAVLLGDADWDGPRGVGLDSTGQILVTSGHGVFEISRQRQPRTTWTVGIPECNGPVLADGRSVLVRHGEGILRVEGGRVTAVGHVGHGDTTLIHGRNGEAWAFTIRTEDNGRPSHTLLFIGSTLADGPAPFRIDFDASVKTCAWLGERRFFLAADGHCGVVDLTVTTRVSKGSWRQTPGHNPAHAVLLSSGDLLLAFVDLSRRRARLVRCDPELESIEELAEFDAFTIHGLVAGPDVVSVLADLRQDPSSPIRPVLFELSPSPPGRFRRDVQVPRSEARGEAVALVAAGRKEDYRLDSRPLGNGGQAQVFEAVHKAGGARVAFKKMSSALPKANRRARREIEAARLFGDHPNVMPVLDSSRAYDWFVMPLAEDSAEARHGDVSDSANLRDLVTAVCDALRIPHQEGWIHRDLKPANTLLLDGRWVVADWGLVRRPRGRTSFLQSHGGIGFGTEGWSAPEQVGDPHGVGPQADIYAIGQIIGWALTGRGPQANKPLLPPDGPWRTVVEAATQEDPAARPADVDELLALIDSVFTPSSPAPVSLPPAAPVPAESPRPRTIVSPQMGFHSSMPMWIPAEDPGETVPRPPRKPVPLPLAWLGRVLLWALTAAFGIMATASVGVTFDQGWGSVGRTVAAIATFAVPFLALLGFVYLDLRRLQTRRKNRLRHPK